MESQTRRKAKDMKKARDMKKAMDMHMEAKESIKADQDAA